MNLINLREIRERMPRSNSTIYSEIERKIFPRPIKIGRSSYWQYFEIERMLAAYAAGATHAELMAICETIHAERQASK